MKIVLVVVLLLLNIANVFLHTLGTYLLRCVYRNGTENPQIVYLLNLSVCEALMNLLEGLRRIPDLIILTGRTKIVITDIQTYVLIVMFTGISFVYYLDMIYLTFDKFMDILLHLRYPVYWNVSKAKWLLIVTWIIGCLLSITISLLHHFTSYIWEEAFFKFFYPTLEFAFIILAILTYGFIFHKYKETRGVPAQHGTNNNQRHGCFHVFRKSRFYISVLLISSFIIFMIIPDLTYLFVAIINEKQSEVLSIICWISYAVSNLVDAYIYIFLYNPARQMLTKIINIRRVRSEVSHTRTTIIMHHI